MTVQAQAWVAGKTWRLDFIDDSIKQLLSKTDRFTLIPHPGSGLTAYYTVSFEAHTPSHWENRILAPRGTVPPPQLPVPLAEQLTPESFEKLARTFGYFFDEYRSSATRLECDITLPGLPQGSLALFFVQNALGGKRDLVVAAFNYDCANRGGMAAGGTV